MLSVISIIALIAFTISTNTVNSLIHINPIFLFAAIAFQFLSWVTWAVRMKTMSEAIGGKISLKNSVAVILSSLFAASITPAHAGSEVVRVQLLRRFKLSIGNASAVVLGEDMLDALFLGIAAPIGFILFQHQMKSNIGLTALFAFCRDPASHHIFRNFLRNSKAKKGEVISYKISMAVHKVSWS